MAATDFSTKLTNYMGKVNLSPLVLATRLEIPLSSIEDWLGGRSTPTDRAQIVGLIEQLILTGLVMDTRQVCELLDLAGFSEPLSSPEGNRLKEAQQVAIKGKGPRIFVEPVPSTRDEKIVRQFGNQLQDLTDLVEKLVSSKTAVLDSDTLTMIRQAAERVQTTGNELTAPIRLPAPEDIEVKLVSSTSLERLSEYQADENLMLALAGLFGGAALGIAVNWMTADVQAVTLASKVALGLFALSAIVFGVQFVRIAIRASKVKAKMFGRSQRPIGTDRH